LVGLFFTWTVLVPWLASSFLFWLLDVFSIHDPGNPVSCALVCCLPGLLGVFYSLFLTVPMVVGVYALMLTSPKLAQFRDFQWGFVILTTIIGGAWGWCFVSGFGAESTMALPIIGAAAGLVLGIATLSCWNW